MKAVSIYYTYLTEDSSSLGLLKLNYIFVFVGHNADDIAETVIMNILRGDIARLRRCTAITTCSDDDGIPRCKPLKYTYEKEIVMYAYFKVRAHNFIHWDIG